MNILNFSEEEKKQWKMRIKAECVRVLEQRINNAQVAMNYAQEAANSDDKSSAGDKHETSRAMSQIDRDMNARQMEIAKTELELLNTIDFTRIHQRVSKGSLVLSAQNIFFVALGLGTIIVDGRKVIVLSLNAPLTGLLNEKKAGDCFTINGKTSEIIDVF